MVEPAWPALGLGHGGTSLAWWNHPGTRPTWPGGTTLGLGHGETSLAWPALGHRTCKSCVEPLTFKTSLTLFLPVPTALLSASELLCYSVWQWLVHSRGDGNGCELSLILMYIVYCYLVGREE